jgi:hypothetical protein
MILGPHEAGAVRKGPADLFALESSLVAQRLGKVRMRQRRPAEPRQGDTLRARETHRYPCLQSSSHSPQPEREALWKVTDWPCPQLTPHLSRRVDPECFYYGGIATGLILAVLCRFYYYQ